MSQGSQGYTPEQRRVIAVRYIMSIQNLTGQRFKPDIRPREQQMIEDTNLILDHLL